MYTERERERERHTHTHIIHLELAEPGRPLTEDNGVSPKGGERKLVEGILKVF